MKFKGKYEDIFDISYDQILEELRGQIDNMAEAREKELSDDTEIEFEVNVVNFKV